MKIKQFFLILGIGLVIVSISNYRYFVEAGSLIVANMTKNPTYYLGDDAGLIGLNHAIWLSDNKKYIEAKNMLLPLLNQAKPEYQAKISELYGDILSVSSGSVDDIVKIYERSYSFETEPRVMKKIDYYKNLQKKSANTASGSTTSGEITSGSRESDLRKQELQKISTLRSKYLNNGPSAQDSMSELARMMQSAESGTVGAHQDW